jgi:hypothetical protein
MVTKLHVSHKDTLAPPRRSGDKDIETFGFITNKKKLSLP